MQACQLAAGALGDALAVEKTSLTTVLEQGTGAQLPTLLSATPTSVRSNSAPA